MNGIEFDGPANDPGPEELIAGSDRQRRRLPNTVWAGLGGLAVLIALVVDLGQRHGSDQPTVSPSLGESNPAPSNAPGASSLLQQQLTALALNRELIAGGVSDATTICPPLHGSPTPTRPQRAAIHHWFPQFGRLESSSTTDSADGLCAITIRSRDSFGTILIVRVNAPPNPPRSEFDVTDYGGSGQLPDFIGADYVSPKGFHTQVGLLLSAEEGITAGSPTAQLAEDAGLAW